MRHSVQVATWVVVDEDSKIAYHVYPVEDTVELTLGGNDDGLVIQTSEAGLRHCVTAFTSALDAFKSAAATQGLPHSAGSAG